MVFFKSSTLFFFFSRADVADLGVAEPRQQRETKDIAKEQQRLLPAVSILEIVDTLDVLVPGDAGVLRDLHQRVAALVSLQDGQRLRQMAVPFFYYYLGEGKIRMNHQSIILFASNGK
jgi:hypothetical protein